MAERSCLDLGDFSHRGGPCGLPPAAQVTETADAEMQNVCLSLGESLPLVSPCKPLADACKRDAA